MHDYKFPAGWRAQDFLLRGYFQGKRDAEAHMAAVYPTGARGSVGGLATAGQRDWGLARATHGVLGCWKVGTESAAVAPTQASSVPPAPPRPAAARPAPPAPLQAAWPYALASFTARAPWAPRKCTWDGWGRPSKRCVPLCQASGEFVCQGGGEQQRGRFTLAKCHLKGRQAAVRPT